MIVGLESNSKIFTVCVHGLLELQVGGAHGHCPAAPARLALLGANGGLSVSSPTGGPVHLHIRGQRGRRLHHHTEWFRFHGHAARRIDTQDDRGVGTRSPMAAVDPNGLVPGATPTQSNHRGRFEGQAWGWHGLDGLSGGERTMWRARGQFSPFSLFFNGSLSPRRGSGMAFPFQIHSPKSKRANYGCCSGLITVVVEDLCINQMFFF